MGQDCRWTISECADQAKVDRLAEEIRVDRVLADLLVKRGIDTGDQAREFFHPSLEKLHDPFLMKDMDAAVERLHAAVKSQERILVWGDYDVDGTTAVALMCSFLRRFSSNVEYYIPDRYEEGSGVSFKGLDWAAENGYTLVIALDCGIKAIDKVEYARERGMDMIICDHHLPEDSLPKAVAVLDPKRGDCNYPFDDLSGCGVGFKLVQGYALRYDIPFDSLEPLLDLLVVSISSDLVSMTGENRILAHFGLIRLNENPRTGLLAMIKISRLEQGHITIDDIVFKIGPRINAAGRMESGRLAVDLLMATDVAAAVKIGAKINENNTERKNIDKEITREALEMVENGTAITSRNITIVYNPDWNKGVVGIVASRLVEAFFKPAVVLTKSNGYVTGSARSVQGFDLYEAIENCSDLMENFGGHIYAAGLTMKEEHLHEFSSRMDSYLEGKIAQEQQTATIEIDSRLDFSQITPKFFRILNQFQPFGPGNVNPVFMTENVYDVGSGRKVGAASMHMRLDLIQENQPYRPLPAIAFNMAEFFDYIKKGNPFDMCYSIVENYHHGNNGMQLRIKDLKEREEII